MAMCPQYYNVDKYFLSKSDIERMPSKGTYKLNENATMCPGSTVWMSETWTQIETNQCRTLYISEGNKYN